MYILWVSLYERDTIAQIGKTIGSTSIRYRSDTFASDRYRSDGLCYLSEFDTDRTLSRSWVWYPGFLGHELRCSIHPVRVQNFFRCCYWSYCTEYVDPFWESVIRLVKPFSHKINCFMWSFLPARHANLWSQVAPMKESANKWIEIRNVLNENDSTCGNTIVMSQTAKH